MFALDECNTGVFSWGLHCPRLLGMSGKQSPWVVVVGGCTRLVHLEGGTCAAAALGQSQMCKLTDVAADACGCQCACLWMPVCMLADASVHACRCQCACLQMPVCMLADASVHACRCQCACLQMPVCMLADASVHACRCWCACLQMLVCMLADVGVHACRCWCACTLAHQHETIIRKFVT